MYAHSRHATVSIPYAVPFTPTCSAQHLPGFVDTALTYGRPGMFLVASPDRVAADALRAVRRDRAVVYSPPFWALVKWVIRRIPDPIFKRLSL